MVRRQMQPVPLQLRRSSGRLKAVAVLVALFLVAAVGLPVRSSAITAEDEGTRRPTRFEPYAGHAPAALEAPDLSATLSGRHVAGPVAETLPEIEQPISAVSSSVAPCDHGEHDFARGRARTTPRLLRSNDASSRPAPRAPPIA